MTQSSTMAEQGSQRKSVPLATPMGRYLLVILFLCCPSLCVSAGSSLNLGVPITRITSNGFSDIYVGGANFIAHLSNLELVLNFSIGPVNEAEHCAPDPAPCDNYVKVLEIDKAHSKLLVCGTAYNGTCTLHSMFPISEWYCLSTDGRDSQVDTLSGKLSQTTTVHFLSTMEIKSTFSPSENLDMFGCRSPGFGSESFYSDLPAPTIRHARVKQPEYDRLGIRRRMPRDAGNGNGKQNSNSLASDESNLSSISMKAIKIIDDIEEDEADFPPVITTFASTLMVAGNTYDSRKGATTPMLLSMRYITFSGFQYTTGYTRSQNDKPVGLDIDSPLKSTFFIDYKLSFQWGNFSYFLSLQQSTCNNQTCIVTKMGRSCHDPSSILPYVEIPLSCEHRGKKYHLLTSAVLGTVGLQLESSYVTVPILNTAFGNGSDPMSTTAERKYGTAICTFTLEQLNKEFVFASQVCSNQFQTLVKPVSWIAGRRDRCYKEKIPVGSCSPNYENPHVQLYGDGSAKSSLFIPEIAVAALLTHTQTARKGGELILVEKMNVYLLTTKGRILKFGLRAKKYTDFHAEVDAAVEAAFDLGESLSNHKFPPVGFTDHDRAIMYISSDTKLISLNLDFCRQHQSCRACRQERGQRCLWCSSENTCLDEETAKTQCSLTTENKCPPRLDHFNPTHVPDEGGSVLTLLGDHLGTQNVGTVNVTVCGLPCDNVLASVNNLTCTIRARCSSCSDKCNITVSVAGQTDSEGTTSSFNSPHHSVLQYVTPNITKFSPSYGPASGGTMIFIDGEYTIVGSRTEIEVAGASCDVIPTTYGLQCRIVKDKSRRPHMGSVVVVIDNFKQIIKDKMFTFSPDPVVNQVTPRESIESGGVTITVSGSNFGSAASAQLILSHTVTRNNKTDIYKFRSTCSNHGTGHKLTCKTPNVKNFTEQRHDATKFNISIDFGGTNLMEYLPGSHTINVYRDPTLFRLVENTTEARISLTQRIFLIRGNDIPSWIDKSDVKVTIGNTDIDVVSLTGNIITVDPIAAIEMSIEDHRNRTKYKNSTDIDGGGTLHNTTYTTAVFDYNMTIAPFNDTGIFTNASFSNILMTTSVPTIKELTTKTIHWRRRKRSSLLMVNSSESTQNYSSDQNWTNMTNNDLFTVPPNEESIGQEATKEPNQDAGFTPLKYHVVVTIGNFKENIGTVTIGPEQNQSWVTPRPTPPNKASKFDLKLVVGASCAGLLLLVLVAVAIAMYVRARKARALMKEQSFYLGSMSGSHGGSKEPAVLSLKQILESVMEPDKRADMDRLIISHDRLTVGRSIGSGNFGCVYEGLLGSTDGGPAKKVAVKTLQDPVTHNIDLHGFVQEAVIMRDFQHAHVLGLIGLAEKEQGVPYVILPYMDNGDLLTHIRDSSVSLSLHDIIKFGADIASGMAYLSALKFVHRDLAARNCMLDSLYRVKVADFGLCRDIYEKGYYTSDNRKKLPIRWMAIESIEHGAYSTKSDVWSLGVVLWELLSRGVTPYPGVDGWDVINYLRHRRLAPPFFCPDELYSLMMKCWAKDPNLRPTFKTVQMELLLMIGQSPTLTDTLTPTLKRGRAVHTSSNPNLTSFRSTPNAKDKAPATTPKPVPHADMSKEAENKFLQAYSAFKKEEQKQSIIQASSQGKEGDKVDGAIQIEEKYSNVVSYPEPTVLKNVLITIPACYSHRDVSKTAAGIYIQLVDNYEPPPKFSNPLLRSKKKHSKKPPERPEKNKKETSIFYTSGYSVPQDNPALRSSAGNELRDQHDRPHGNSSGSLEVKLHKDGNYYELETTSVRSSATSDIDSQSSSALNKTGSVASLLDSRCSSSYSASRASGASNLSVPITHRSAQAPAPAVRRKSPLVTPSRGLKYHDVQEQDEGSGNTDVNNDVITSL